MAKCRTNSKVHILQRHRNKRAGDVSGRLAVCKVQVQSISLRRADRNRGQTEQNENKKEGRKEPPRRPDAPPKQRCLIAKKGGTDHGLADA